MEALERMALAPGSILHLEMMDDAGTSVWEIGDVIGYGGSCIVYTGRQTSSVLAQERIGIVKEFYPTGVSGIFRRGEQLFIPDESREAFLEKRDRFFTGFEKREQHFQIDPAHALARPFLYGQANGTWYAVCEESPGKILSVCPHSSLSLPRIARIMHSLCNAIGALHDHGMLYLDCKPDNIYFQDIDQIDSIRLFDFDTVLEKRHLRQVQYGSYSDGWAPPEQKNWNVRAISEKTDIYSIGAVFFWLLTWRKPTGGTLHISYDTQSDLEQIKEQTYPWAKEPLLAHMPSGDVIDLVQQIASHTLALSPSNRYESVSRLDQDFQKLYWLTHRDPGTVAVIQDTASELQREVQDAREDVKQELKQEIKQAIKQESEKISAEAALQTERIQESIRQHAISTLVRQKRFWFVAIPAVLVLALVAGILFGWGSQTVERAVDVTEIQTDVEEYILLALNQGNHVYEMGIENWRRLDYNRALRDIRSAYEEIRSAQGEAAVELAKINHSLGCLYLDMGEYQNAYDHLNSAYITFSHSLGEDSLATRAVKAAIARYDYETGDFENALRTTTEILDNTDTETELAVAVSVLHLRAMVYEGRGQYQEALSIYQGVLTMYEDISQDGQLRVELANYANDPNLSVTEKDYLSNSLRWIASTYANLAEVLLQMNLGNEALEAVQTGIQLCTDNEYALGTENLITAKLYMLCARARLLLSNNRYAYYDIDQAMRIEKKLFDYEGDYPGLTEVYEIYGNVCTAIGETDQASEYYRMAIDLATSSFGENHARTAEAYHVRGRFWLRNSEFAAKALEDFSRAVLIRQNILGYTHPTTIAYLEDQARAQFVLGMCEDVAESLWSVAYIRDKLQGVEGASVTSGQGSLLSIEQRSYASEDDRAQSAYLFIFDAQEYLIAEVFGSAFSQYVYYYEYDDAGRLIRKTSSTSQNYAYDTIERSFDTIGRLLSSNEWLNGTQVQRDFRYDDDTRPTEEVWTLASGTTFSFSHVYLDHSDGSYADTRHCQHTSQPFDGIEDVTSLYDANGARIRGFSEYLYESEDNNNANSYWKNQIEYAYVQYPALEIVYETSQYEDGTYTSMYAVFCDTTGREIKKIYLGSDCLLEQDTLGNLAAAWDSYSYFTFTYTEDSEQTYTSAPSTWERMPTYTVTSWHDGASTALVIASDWSFSGTFEKYEADTVYACQFGGQFSRPVPVDDTTYTIELLQLHYDESDTVYPGFQRAISEPYGLSVGEEYLIFTPGTALRTLPETFYSQASLSEDIRATLPDDYYGIYNAAQDLAWTPQDCFWKTCYSNWEQDRESYVWPSFTYPTTICLSAEAYDDSIRICFSWSADTSSRFIGYQVKTHSGYLVDIAVAEDKSSIAVELTSLAHDDLSLWGGTEDGHLEIIFTKRTESGI